MAAIPCFGNAEKDIKFIEIGKVVDLGDLELPIEKIYEDFIASKRLGMDMLRFAKYAQLCAGGALLAFALTNLAQCFIVHANLDKLRRALPKLRDTIDAHMKIVQEVQHVLQRPPRELEGQEKQIEQRMQGIRQSCRELTLEIESYINDAEFLRERSDVQFALSILIGIAAVPLMLCGGAPLVLAGSATAVSAGTVYKAHENSNAATKQLSEAKELRKLIDPKSLDKLWRRTLDDLQQECGRDLCLLTRPDVFRIRNWHPKFSDAKYEGDPFEIPNVCQPEHLKFLSQFNDGKDVFGAKGQLVWIADCQSGQGLGLHAILDIEPMYGLKTCFKLKLVKAA